MRRLILFTLLGMSVVATAHATDMAALNAAKQTLQAGVTASKAEDMLNARAAFAALEQQNPKDANLACWIAVASWRAVPILQGSDNEQAKRVCKDGIAAADRAISLNPRLVEAIAVKAGLQGLSISFNPATAMTLSPEMDEGFSRAEAIDAKNPRVLLLKAMNTMHKPEFVGGGAKRAMPQFERAIALFAAQKAPAPGTQDWGRVDADLWAGRCQMKLGDAQKAKTHYERAMGMDPDNVWVSKVLMPAAETQLAKASSK